MKKSFQFSILVLALSFAASCNEMDSPNGEQNQHSPKMQINGNCEIYSLENEEGEAWNLVSDSEWIVPVKSSGESSDKIEIYIESNSSEDRSGEVTIEYANGITKSTVIQQDTRQTQTSLQRSYAAGWGFDVTSYMDSRGLKDQIFNTQKVSALNRISNEEYTATQVKLYFGEDYQSLNQSLTAELDLGINVNAFEMGLKGTFGGTALSNSKRIFSWMRGIYCQRSVDMNVTPLMAQDENLFTYDFALDRQKIISDPSDANIRELINHYGTHYVKESWLGGYLDYYFSSVVTEIEDVMEIKGAIELGYAKQFNLKGNAEYEDTYKELNTDKIETFLVRGGNAIDLTNKVITGSMTDTDLQDWLKSLDADNAATAKVELLDFELKPIFHLFPSKVSEKIENYINKIMYYGDLPVTRTDVEQM